MAKTCILIGAPIDAGQRRPGCLMGPAAYEEMAIRAEAHLAQVKAVRARGVRKLLPLLVHPATIEAQRAK